MDDRNFIKLESRSLLLCLVVACLDMTFHVGVQKSKRTSQIYSRDMVVTHRRALGVHVADKHLPVRRSPLLEPAMSEERSDEQ